MISQIRKCLASLPLQTESKLTQKSTHHSIPVLFSSSSTTSGPIPTTLFLTDRHEFSRETAAKASSAVAVLKNPGNIDSTLSYLKEIGLSKTHLEKLIRAYPKILSSNLETIKPKIKIFHDSGFSPSDVVGILSAVPWLLSHGGETKLRPCISRLKSIMGSNEATIRMLVKSYGWVVGREEFLRANFEYLEKRCGISSAHITSYSFIYPRVLLQKPESIAEGVRRVDQLGFDRSSKKLMQAIRVMCSTSPAKWERRLESFRRLGFGDDEVVAMFKRSPQVLCVSEEKLKRCVELFLKSRRVDKSYVVGRPDLMLYSVDRRAKPRLRVLEVLEKRGLLSRWPSLSSILVQSSAKFFEKYVRPYPHELGASLCGRLAVLNGISPCCLKIVM